MSDKVDVDTIRFAYESATGIHVCARLDEGFNVGLSHIVYKSEDRWAVGRRWSSYDTGSGHWDGGVEEVDEADGGGRFAFFESALRVALNLEFEERLSRAFSEIGDLELRRIERKEEG